MKPEIQTVANQILSSQQEPQIVSEALELLFRSRIGGSESPAQNLLNWAVAKALNQVHVERLEDIILAHRIWRLARTQRTKYFPEAYCAARSAYDSILTQHIEMIPRDLMPELYVRARRAILYAQPACVEQAVDTIGTAVAAREAHSPVWFLHFRTQTQKAQAPGYFAVGILSARSIRLEARVIAMQGPSTWIEVKVHAARRLRCQLFGADFKISPDGIQPTEVGEILVRSPRCLRQGGLGLVPKEEFDETQFRRPPTSEYSSHLAPWCKLEGDWRMLVGPTTVEHPQHPPLYVPDGNWIAVQYSRPVRPRLRGDFPRD